MRGKLVRPASRASRTSTTSSVKNVLDDFDSKRMQTPKKTSAILFPQKRNREYDRIVRRISGKRKVQDADACAIKIQSAWRMYRVRCMFSAFFDAFKDSRRASYRSIFNILLLNSHVSTVDRMSCFKYVQKEMSLAPKYGRGYVRTDNETFAITGMYAIPGNMNPKKLVKCVKAVYSDVMHKVFDAWRLTARTSRRLKRAVETIDTNQMKLNMFKYEFVCFQMWRQLVRFRNPEYDRWHDKVYGSVPHWNNFQQIAQTKARLREKADKIRRRNIKENVIQALRFLLQKRKHSNAIRVQSDKYTIRRRMKFAVAAWMKYVVTEQNKVLMKKVVVRKWLQCVQKRKHTEMILTTMTTRHEHWLKRQMMDVFHKIRKVQPILSTWSYLRIQRNPALALYFANIIRNDAHGSALTRCFNSWVAYIRRKRRWHHFVFKNTVVSEYTPLKRRVLANLRNKPCPYLTDTDMTDCDFKCETMDTYMEVMRDGVDPNSIFMLYEGDAPVDIQPPRNRVQQRENFFKVWETQETNISLFMRAAVIYCAKKQAQNARETDGIAEKTYLQYKKAMAFLAEMNLASDGKFSAVQRTIEVNNKRIIGNRQRCLRRDKLLMLAHDSHGDAVDLHGTKPVFVPEDQTKIFERIKSASDELIRSFEPLLPLSALGSVLEQPNESSFITVAGCRAKPTDFRKTITDCHKIIKDDIIRSEIGHDAASRFDRFFGGSEKISCSSGGVKTNVHSEPYNRNLGPLPARPRPKTGISRKLLERFPLEARKPKVIGRQTKQFNMNLLLPNEEVTPEEEIHMEYLGSQHLELEGRTNSTFFSGMSSFASLLSNASQAVLKTKKKKAPVEILDVLEPVVEEIIVDEEEDTYVEEPIHVKWKPKPKDSMEKSAPTIEATEIDQSLVDGFDDVTLMSLRKVKDLESPRSAEKYKMFLEILFGKGNREQNNAIVNNIRRKIMAEYRARKSAQAGRGIITNGLVRPVTNVMEKFRRDKKIKTKWSDADDFIESMTSRAPLKPPDEATEMECTYNSRKFRPIPKPEKPQQPAVPGTPGIPASPVTRRVKRRQRKHRVSVTPLKLNLPDTDADTNTDDKGTILASAHSTHSTQSVHTTRSVESVQPDVNSSRSESTVNEPQEPTARSAHEEDQYEYEYEYEYWDDDSDASFREDLMDQEAHAHITMETEKVHDEEEQSGEIADEDFDAAAVPERRIPQQNNRFTRFETATPYTSVRGDATALQRVNKIAFRILESNIREDGTLNSLVDVDNDVMPALNLNGFINNNGRLKNLGNNEEERGPKYRMRNCHKAQIQRNKSPFPIVTPNKREITSEMKKAIGEETRFAGLRYDEGKSITRKSRHETQHPYTPVYKFDKKAESATCRVHFDDETQVVSFKSGARQQGSDASNFIPVRISSTKQRAITKPLHTTPKKADLRQSRPESQMSKTRNCYSKITNIVNELVRMMACHNDHGTFEAFRVNARLTRKKAAPIAFDEKSSLETTEFYSQIQSIYVQYASHQNLRETASHLIKLTKSNQEFGPVLLRSLESAVKEKTSRIQDEEKRKVVDRSNFDPNLAAQYVDISWMTESQLRYKAVAIQYSENSITKPNAALEAVIESTVPTPTRGRSRDTARAPVPMRRQEWDDVIRDYDLNEMMLVTPCVVPEREVDDLLAIYRRSH